MKGMLYGVSSVAVFASLISIALCGFFIYTVIINKERIEKLQIEHLILEKNIRINEEISRLLNKTQALSALVIQGNGDIENFDRAASSIIADDPVILNVLIAPNDIISKVYPRQGSETAIGLDFSSEASGNKEARLAKDIGGLVLGGPFTTIQGNDVLVGRMPVYIDTPTEKSKYWGLVSVTLRFPQVLENMRFEILKDRGFVYELWRINPDTGARQIITHSPNYTRSPPNFVEGEIHVFNAVWYLKVWPIHAWYSYPENLFLIAVFIFICFIVFFVMQNNHELRKMKSVFEKMANVDPVTGIFNRRYMDENLKRVIGTLSRSSGMLSMLMIDVDLFKNYNDTYGHSKGDVCLRIIAQLIHNNLLRADDFVARYGGEEFAVILPNTNEHGARMVSERLIEGIRNRKIPHESSTVASHLTISIGSTTGMVQHTYIGNDFIKRADRALYMSKQNGRDRYTFLNL
jgi:diguanylate cyclase (GGDEF)-like protein